MMMVMMRSCIFSENDGSARSPNLMREKAFAATLFKPQRLLSLISYNHLTSTLPPLRDDFSFKDMDPAFSTHQTRKPPSYPLEERI